ncbi:MAG: FAD:protein FMN transferase, partial [Muribaculaceae bacterium]|nr:FAD:protein FMN transferase [Muribaculaceae bacterium]
ADGSSYGHTINPLTGYPAETDLLSVTVVAPTCIQADALATALMAMGETELKKVAPSLPAGIEVFYTVATPSGPEMHELR